MRIAYDEDLVMDRIHGMMDGIGAVPATKDAMLEREFRHAKATRTDLLNAPKFSARYEVKVINGQKMYTRIARKFSSEWRKVLKGSKTSKKNAFAKAAILKAIAREPMTEDEALFVYIYYNRRKRAHMIRARKKRKGAYGALLVVGATVGAFLLAPVIFGGAGTAATGAGAAAPAATAAAAPSAAAAATAAAAAPAVAPVAVTTATGASAAAKAAKIATEAAKLAKKAGATDKEAKGAASSSWWEALLNPGKVPSAVEKLVPGLKPAAKPGIPVVVTPKKKIWERKSVLIGVPAAAAVIGLGFKLWKG